MDQMILTKYAELVVKAGINLYEGQSLQIRTPLANYPFALLLAETAYKNGAKIVDIDIDSYALTKLRLDHTPQEHLNYAPAYITVKSVEQVADDWAFIFIDNMEEQDVLKDCSPDNIKLLTQTDQKAKKVMIEQLMKYRNPWCVIGVPGPNWAASIFSSVTRSEAEEKLWAEIIKIIRLDAADPIAEWKKTVMSLSQRAKRLTDLKLSRLHFKNSETDLEIGLQETIKWVGGPEITSGGRFFSPNIPTEEVFTTPDCRETNGRIKVSRPVDVLDNIVEEASLTFKDGRVVDYDAKKGKEFLGKFLQIDEGASFLGEVALVDSSSLIYQSGLLFNSILFDENASCHIALGSAYPCFTNAAEIITNDDRKKMGYNTSLVHIDFMIGTPDIEVDGYDRQGKKIILIKDGRFTV